MEKIKKFNLEVALFVKELNSYIHNVNETNDETIKLLTETIIGINKLQSNSIFHETSSPSLNESAFVNNLNDDIFKCRRFIVCCLCHEQIPLNLDDFNAHIQKRDHQEKEAPQNSFKTNNVNDDPNSKRKINIVQNEFNVKTIPNLTPTLKATVNVIKPPGLKMANISDGDSKIFNRFACSSSYGKPPSLTRSISCVNGAPSVKYSVNKTTINSQDVIAKIKNKINALNSEESNNINRETNADQSKRACMSTVKRLEVTELISSIEKDISDSCVSSLLDTRKRSELEIVSALQKYVHEFYPSSKLYPFGSCQFGIGTTNSNFNLLVKTNDKKSKDICPWFYLKLKQTDILRHFTGLHKINADRVMKGQISMIHITSGIECRLSFEKDDYIVQSTDIIKRFAAQPICNFLIDFVRTWQITLNRLEISCFKFNTYIISILVIFFLQMDYNFPTSEKTSNNAFSEVSNFKLVLKEFFHFYGYRYQMKKHIISTKIGRWEERQIQPGQVFFTSAQKRLRMGIATQPKNWQNCTMRVQDLVQPEVNATAEISNKEAENFQQMCQLFGQNM